MEGRSHTGDKEVKIAAQLVFVSPQRRISVPELFLVWKRLLPKEEVSLFGLELTLKTVAVDLEDVLPPVGPVGQPLFWSCWLRFVVLLLLCVAFDWPLCRLLLCFFLLPVLTFCRCRRRSHRLLAAAL